MKHTVAALVVMLVIGVSPIHSQAWRSALYPAGWKPGTTDAKGRFLHDFSYAGYHRGEKALPTKPPGAVVDVTKAPYGADSTGAKDATLAIQKAIDSAGAKGGGVVYLPAGTFRISLQPGKDHALWIAHSKVVLRGAGPGKTFVLNASTDVRARRVIVARPQASGLFGWHSGIKDLVKITADLKLPTATIPVSSTAGYKVGDWIVVGAEPTAAFIAAHKMTGEWTPKDLWGQTFYRQITAIAAAKKTITIDIPTRYPLLLRDNARVYHIKAHLEEVGVEGLALGNLQNTTPGTGSMDYQKPGTGAYQMHASFFVVFNHVVNSWVRNVKSFRPTANKGDVHLLSNGLELAWSRSITVDSVELSKPQYKGQGGNGYMFVLGGSDCLIRKSTGSNARHNYSFKFLAATGNVIHASATKNGQEPADYHQRLSAANLIDNMTVQNDYLSAAFRDCCTHGHATSQSVFWNTNGLAYHWKQWLIKFIVKSQQFGHGYVIGTRGAATNVSAPGGFGTEPVDLVEGAGKGATLVPASLYLDQLARRLGIPAGPDAGVAKDGGAPGDSAAHGDGNDPADGGKSPGDSSKIPGDGSPADGRHDQAGGGDGAVVDSDAGCSCELGSPASEDGHGWPLALLTVLGGLLARRRRGDA